MKRLGLALAALLAPGLALAGEITLFNTSGGPIEIRAVRAGVVKLADGESKTFLYPAESGDFRVFVPENRCDYVFLFEASDDAKLQVGRGPMLFRLPAAADKAMEGAALRAAQPRDWPLAPPLLDCERN